MPSKTPCLTTALVLFATGASAVDIKARIAAHLKPANAELEISTTRTATAEGRPVQVACGIATVRIDAGNFSSRTFAYVIDDDKLWLTGEEEWLKEPQKMGVVQVMKLCPGN